MSKAKKIIALVGLIIASLILLFVIVMMIKSKKPTTTTIGGREGYTKIDSVPGVTFEVNQNLADYATAVMEISTDIDFVQNATYSYRNGKDTYMLFNMSQYIIAVKKGTNFNLGDRSIDEALASNSLDGIWFTKTGAVESVNGVNILDVTGQVVITNQIYNDFSGKLAIIKKDDQEWSLFVGAVNANDAMFSDMIRYTAATFMADASNKGADQTVYEMDIEDKPTLVEVSPVKDKEEEKEEPGITVADPTPAPTPEATPEPTKEPEATPEPTKQPESTPEPTMEPDATPEPTPEATPEPTPEATEAPILVEKPTNEKAYTSTLYSMLKPGKTGYMTAANQNGTYDELFIKVKSVNDEATTKAMVESYVKSGKSYFTTADAPMGTHWESVTYDVKCNSLDDYYINIQMVGFDGEKLKFRGIGYTKRTYDLNVNAYEDHGWVRECVAFYAVPNGCYDYAIACGDSVEGVGYKAYYQIKNPKPVAVEETVEETDGED